MVLDGKIDGKIHPWMMNGGRPIDGKPLFLTQGIFMFNWILFLPVLDPSDRSNPWTCPRLDLSMRKTGRATPEPQMLINIC